MGEKRHTPELRCADGALRVIVSQRALVVRVAAVKMHRRQLQGLARSCTLVALKHSRLMQGRERATEGAPCDASCPSNSSFILSWVFRSELRSALLSPHAHHTLLTPECAASAPRSSWPPCRWPAASPVSAPWPSPGHQRGDAQGNRCGQTCIVAEATVNKARNNISITKSVSLQRPLLVPLSLSLPLSRTPHPLT